jgi:hypothetical protein
MTGDLERSGYGGSPFRDADASFNMYALANGMDLVKADKLRRFEWYRDGMDRGILVSISADDLLEVTAMAWMGDVSTAQTQSVAGPLSREEFSRSLTCREKSSRVR